MSNAPNQISNPLEFNVKKYERPGVKEQEILDIKEAFDLFNTDLDGAIDPNELQAAMQSMGFEVDRSLIDTLIRAAETGVSKHKDGRIDFEEFLDLMTMNSLEARTQENLEEVFDLFARENKNYITMDDIKNACREVKEQIDEAEIQEMWKRADFDKDGKVSKEDFINLMMYKK